MVVWGSSVSGKRPSIHRSTPGAVLAPGEFNCNGGLGVAGFNAHVTPPHGNLGRFAPRIQWQLAGGEPILGVHEVGTIAAPAHRSDRLTNGHMVHSAATVASRELVLSRVDNGNRSHRPILLLSRFDGPLAAAHAGRARTGAADYAERCEPSKNALGCGLRCSSRGSATGNRLCWVRFRDEEGKRFALVGVFWCGVEYNFGR